MENLGSGSDDQKGDNKYNLKDDSEDEVFIGKMCLDEVKRRVFMNTHRNTISFDMTPMDLDKSANSIKIIEVHSAPDIVSERQTEFILDKDTNDRCISNPNISQRESCSYWDVKPEDSFLKLEKMVSNLFMSPKKEELDSTLDIMHEISINNSNSNTAPDLLSEIKADTNETNIVPETPKQEIISSSKQLCKVERKQEACSNSIQKSDKLGTPIFKTPSTTIKGRKHLNVHNKNPIKTIHKFNAYEHVISPVASYIKKSQVPLVKDVCPKKPLMGSSHIPKPIKSNIEPKGNKENVILTPVAYKSAKKTKVINLPDKEKMPKSPWAKQIATTLPKSFVIKHDHRETNLKTKPVSSFQDSFADLSLHQADVSVCTQKSAFKKL